MRPRSFVLALAAASLLAAPSGAQNRSDRREFDRLVRSAVSHYERGENREAIQDLERAYAITPAARLLYNLGRANEAAGDWAAAAGYYERFLASNPDRSSAQVAQEALAVARRRAAEAEQRDRERREAEASQRERDLADARRRAAEAERERLQQQQRAAWTLVPPRRRVTPLITGMWVGAGAMGIAAAVLGGVSLAAQGDLQNTRDGQRRSDAYELGTATAIGADAALGTALVMGVVGVVLYFTQTPTAPDDPAAPGAAR